MIPAVRLGHFACSGGRQLLASMALELKISTCSDVAAASALPDLRVADLRRVLLPWLLIQGVLAVIGWFRRTYARNLGELIGTVLLSLAYEPIVWLRNGHHLAERAPADLAGRKENAHWQGQPPVVYGLGHSLGVLLSLSLPALQEEHPWGRCLPVGILAPIQPPAPRWAFPALPSPCCGCSTPLSRPNR
jgi:hypothetical protein